MHVLNSLSLGETWAELVARTLECGSGMDDQGIELLHVQVSFPATETLDPLLERFADRAMIEDMHKVFFSDEPNRLGHSYASRMRGPRGRADLQDIVELLRADPSSKRAVLTLCGEGKGDVPCINVVQFLIRSGKIDTSYFARGQDVFRKFYADGLCLGTLALRVAAGLQIPAGNVTGFITSSHIYNRDLPAIREFLNLMAELQPAEKGGC